MVEYRQEVQRLQTTSSHPPQIQIKKQTKNLKGLWELWAMRTPELTDLSHLKHLKNLEEVRFGWSSDLSELN